MDEDEKEDEREDGAMTSVTVADSAAFPPPEFELKVLRPTRHKTMEKLVDITILIVTLQ